MTALNQSLEASSVGATARVAHRLNQNEMNAFSTGNPFKGAALALASRVFQVATVPLHAIGLALGAGACAIAAGVGAVGIGLGAIKAVFTLNPDVLMSGVSLVGFSVLGAVALVGSVPAKAIDIVMPEFELGTTMANAIADRKEKRTQRRAARADQGFMPMHAQSFPLHHVSHWDTESPLSSDSLLPSRFEPGMSRRRSL